jgi:hypothetical protein
MVGVTNFNQKFSQSVLPALQITSKGKKMDPPIVKDLVKPKRVHKFYEKREKLEISK